MMVHLRRPTMTLLIGCLLSLAYVLIGAHPSRMSNTRGFIFDPAHTQFSIPFSIKVGFCGLNRDGAESIQLQSEEVQMNMEDAMSIYVPVDRERKEEVKVQYHIEYFASHLHSEMLMRLENSLRDNMKLIGHTADGIAIFDIDASKVLPVIEDMYMHEFTSQPVDIDLADSGVGERTQPESVPTAFIVVNPDKIRMNPLKNKPYIYRYRYDHGAPTQVWIAEKRFVFVDLSAGPITYGVSDAGDGTVTIGIVPLLDIKPSETADPTTGAPINYASTKFTAELSSFLLSAVRHVFISDLQFSQNKYAEKLVIPLIIFRNHRRFHPLRQGGGYGSLGEEEAPEGERKQGPVNEFEIDLMKVRTEVSKLLLPEQELLFIHGTHHLHDHPHVSQAVWKALKQDSLQRTTSEGSGTSEGASTRPAQVARPYLSSEILLRELEHASDSIVGNLLKSEDGSVDEAVMTQALPGEEDPSSIAKAKGHRILPVFVLSLLGLPPNVLLDGKYLSVANNKCVVVLQTADPPVSIPYFTDGHLLTINPRHSTRHVVSGLASSIGSLSPTYERFDLPTKQPKPNYLWSTGAIPFGPFSNSTKISWILSDSGIRNSILSRISESLRSVQRAMDSLSDFEESYVLDTHDELMQLLRYGAFRSRVGGRDTSNMQLFGVAKEVSTRLVSQLQKIEEQMLSLSTLLSMFHYQSAYKASGSVLILTKAFEKYAASEIEIAKERLQCCHKVHTIDPSHGASSGPGTFMSFCLIFLLAGVVYAGLRWKLPKEQGGQSYARHTDLLRPIIGSIAAQQKQRTW